MAPSKKSVYDLPELAKYPIPDKPVKDYFTRDMEKSSISPTDKYADISRTLKLELIKIKNKDIGILERLEGYKSLEYSTKFDKYKECSPNNLEEIIGKKSIENKYIIDYPSTKFTNKYYNSSNILPLISKGSVYAKFSKGGISQLINSYDGDVQVNADNLGEFALPIVDFIQATSPDYIVACDRGARLLGLAVHRLYRELHGRLPTVDGTLRFRRFSKSESCEATEEHLKPLVEEMLSNRKTPVVLVLDDWVASGGTKELVRHVFRKLGKGKIDVKFGVLVGNGADISGKAGRSGGFAGVTDWRDDSNIIGVRYDGSYESTIKARPVVTLEAREYRERMQKGIDALVKRIREERSKEDSQAELAIA